MYAFEKCILLIQQIIEIREAIIILQYECLILFRYLSENMKHDK